MSEVIVIAKCVACGHKREIRAGETDPDMVPFCEKCHMPMVAESAKLVSTPNDRRRIACADCGAILARYTVDDAADKARAQAQADTHECKEQRAANRKARRNRS